MKIETDDLRIMLRKSFSIPSKRLFQISTNPDSFVKWFQPDARFPLNRAWAFVSGNEGGYAGLCFGIWGRRLPEPIQVETPEQKSQLSGFEQYSNQADDSHPAVTAWFQDLQQESMLHVRYVFDASNARASFEESGYIEFFEKQLERLTDFINAAK